MTRVFVRLASVPDGWLPGVQLDDYGATVRVRISGALAQPPEAVDGCVVVAKRDVYVNPEVKRWGR